MTFVECNVLNQGDRTVNTTQYDSLILYLIDYYPQGFKTPCDVSVNGINIEVDKYDMKLKEDDVIVLLFRPGATAVFGIAAGTWGAIAINLAVSVAASYAIGKLFGPEIPEFQTSTSPTNGGQASSTYSLNSNQNEAKRGTVIPIIYGKIRTYPALINEPYFRYENNDEYLYQTMCIGQGRFNINEVLVSETTSQHIKTDIFKYQKLELEQFSGVDGIKNSVNDDNYWELTHRLDDVQNLELRGTPSLNTMTMRFEGTTITFYPDANGNEPDLTSLTNGSEITISETESNDGVYIVDFVTDLVVTVQSHTFVTEPTDSKTYNLNNSGDSQWHIREQIDNITSIHRTESGPSTDYNYYSLGMDNGSIFIASGSLGNSGFEITALSETAEYTLVKPNLTDNYQATGTIIYSFIAKPYKAEFETSYGPFLIKDLVSEAVEFAEIDTNYLGGVYGYDIDGNFIDHTVIYNLTLVYKDDTLGDGEQTFAVSQTGRENDAIRVSNRYAIPSTWYNVYLSLKRETPEPLDNKTYDKIHIRAVKVLHTAPDNTDYGNITLLWAKVKASNAINNIGQFSINAWVTRNDVTNDISSVIKDLYTSTVYGGRLALEDLSEFPDTPDDVVNGAIDTKMTLFDAMSMVAKSKRYSVYPVGSKLQLKHDTVKPIRTALFNETNFIKDSLKISYLFEEIDDTDSYKVMYRSADDFSEQEVIYGSTGLGSGLFPDEIELWGCTDKSAAESMASYMYKQDKARRKSVEFKTDVQGLIPQFLDRIGIASVLPSWGYASVVLGVNGSDVTINDEINQSYDKVLFINDNGSVSDILDCVVSGKTVTVTNLPTWVHGWDENEPTRMSIGNVSDIVRDYIVTNIKPNGNEVTIMGTNYDEGIYS